MKKLFKKILACCLVVCMVFTLCISAVTVSAEEATFDGALTIGNAEVAAGAKEATVSFTALAEKDGIAAAKVNVTLPDGATGISKVELVEADENVQVEFGVSEGKPLVALPGENPEDPDGADVYVYEGNVNIIENVFSYILWVYDYSVDVTKVATTVEITFVGDFSKPAPVTAAIEACKDDVDLLNLKVEEGEINVAAHTCTPAEAVQENVKPATCYADGSYDEVVYCSECGEEISRTPKTIDKIAHTPAEAVVENEVAATCYAKGSYESVVYCSVEACKAEISRTPVTVEKTEHTPATAVVENEVAATCLAAGSYESVVYCSVAECKHEISRTTIPVEALKHDYTYKNDGDTHSATCPNGCAGITGEAHNYVDGECVCGAKEVTGPVRDNTLSTRILEHRILIDKAFGFYYNIYIPKKDYNNYDSIELHISKPEIDRTTLTYTGNRETVVLTDADSTNPAYASSGLFYFNYPNISLFEMNIEVNTTVYLIKDGEAVAYYDYGNKTLSQLANEYYVNNNADDVKRQFAVSLLNLGTAAQVHFAETKPDGNVLEGLPLPNANITNTNDVPDYHGILEDVGGVRDSEFLSIGLMYEKAPTLYYTYYKQSTDLTNCTFTVSYQSKNDKIGENGLVTYTAKGSELGGKNTSNYLSMGMAYISFEDSTLYDTNKVITATITDASGNVISTHQYSVHSKLYEVADKTDGTLGELYKSTATFVASAAQFWPQYA